MSSDFMVFVFKSLLALYFLYIRLHYWLVSLLENLVPNEFLVSKETAVLRRWENETKIWFSQTIDQTSS